jgi:hypothetical protein
MNDLIQKNEWNFNTFAWADEQELPGFGKLLNSWLQVHKNFCTGVRPENSWEWDYKERSQVGFLSNASVLIGGIALEEWGTSKKSGYGRNDLWLRLPTQNGNHDYFIEAKHESIDLFYFENNLAQNLSIAMGNALADAERLSPKNGKAVAVSFFNLRFNNETIDNLDERASDLLNNIKEKQSRQLGLNALASIYLGAEDFHKNRLERKDLNEKWTSYEVGLILMAKLVNAT